MQFDISTECVNHSSDSSGPVAVSFYYFPSRADLPVTFGRSIDRPPPCKIDNGPTRTFSPPLWLAGWLLVLCERRKTLTGGNTRDDEEDAMRSISSCLQWDSGPQEEEEANESMQIPTALDGDEEAPLLFRWTIPFSCQWANSFIVHRNIIIRLDGDLCNDHTICILTFLLVCFTSDPSSAKCPLFLRRAQVERCGLK